MRRATWVWTRPDPADLLEWASRAGVGELFVALEPDATDAGDLRWLGEVVQRARRVGTRVAALGGDARWLDRPEDARAWARRVLGTGLVDGIHLDLEPWSRDDWDSCGDELVTAYLDVLRRVAGQCAQPLEVDLTHWLHEVVTAGGARLDEAVMGIVDAVTVLSFRTAATGPDSITEVGTPTLLAAARLGVPCRLAVETTDLGPEPSMRRQTFHGRGATALAGALAAVDALQQSVPSYRGVAVHDQEGWAALASAQALAKE